MIKLAVKRCSILQAHPIQIRPPLQERTISKRPDSLTSKNRPDRKAASLDIGNWNKLSSVSVLQARISRHAGVTANNRDTRVPGNRPEHFILLRVDPLFVDDVADKPLRVLRGAGN
jgi:hypothetical protein